jgi:hypothetical protein
MNVLTIELCAEDRARLDKIIEGLGALRRPDCSSCVEGVASYMAKAAEVMDADPVAPAAPAAPVPVVTPAKPAVTLEQIQKKATQIAAGSADKKAALRAIVNQYAAKVTDLPESTWPTVWDALCKLESEA